MLTITVCKFNRTKDSAEENGIILNSDQLIIDAHGKPVKKAYDYRALAFKGHIVFNMLTHWDSPSEKELTKREKRLFTMSDKTDSKGEHNMPLKYLLMRTEFSDKEVNYIASLQKGDTYITSDKIKVTRTR